MRLEVDFHPLTADERPGDVDLDAWAALPNDEKGKCHAYCLASIFNVDLDDIPLWGEPLSWGPRNAWLRQHQVSTMRTRNVPAGPVPRWSTFPIALDDEPPGFFSLGILIGTFPGTEIGHAVVYSFISQKVIHDPKLGDRDPVLAAAESLQVFWRAGQ